MGWGPEKVSGRRGGVGGEEKKPHRVSEIKQRGKRREEGRVGSFHGGEPRKEKSRLRSERRGSSRKKEGGLHKKTVETGGLQLGPPVAKDKGGGTIKDQVREKERIRGRTRRDKKKRSPGKKKRTRDGEKAQTIESAQFIG